MSYKIFGFFMSPINRKDTQKVVDMDYQTQNRGNKSQKLTVPQYTPLRFVDISSYLYKKYSTHINMEIKRLNGKA